MSLDIQEIVVEYITNNLDKKILNNVSINLDTLLREELDLDSMGSVMMIMNLEDRLNVSLQAKELHEMKTVGDVVSIISTKLNAKS